MRVQLVIDVNLINRLDVALRQHDRHVQVFVFLSATSRDKHANAADLALAVNDRDRIDVALLVYKGALSLVVKVVKVDAN